MTLEISPPTTHWIGRKCRGGPSRLDPINLQRYGVSIDFRIMTWKPIAGSDLNSRYIGEQSTLDLGSCISLGQKEGVCRVQVACSSSAHHACHSSQTNQSKHHPAKC